MAGKALVSFADFLTATNERVIAAPKDIISDAVNNTYVLADMVKGKGADQVVQAGAFITDRLQLVAGSQFEFYQPNQQFQPVIEDTLSKIRADWRFAKDAWAWTDHELELNEGDRLVQFKSLRDSKRQASTVSLYNGMEAAMWATPDTTTMESSTGTRPYSIRAFVTENGNAPSGFTTIMGIDPTAIGKSRWVNQVENYIAASMDSTLIPAFERMWADLKFERPDTKENYFRETKWNKFKIYTNTDGWANYVRLTRLSNDTAMKGNKPDLGYAVEDAMFGGIPVSRITALNGVGYSTGQPRFFWLNYEFLFPVFHSKRYMYETDPIFGGAAQPFSWVVYKDCWYNLFCRSRYRQGIVVPV